MAKSAHNFDPHSVDKAQARAAKGKPKLDPGSFTLEPEVRNVSADPNAMPSGLMPRRPAPAPSDPMHARFVDQRPAPRERMISGRFGRKMNNVEPGTKPSPGSFEHFAATTCHRHPRDRRPEPQARNWSATRPSTDWERLGGYPEPGQPVTDASAWHARLAREQGYQYPHDPEVLGRNMRVDFDSEERGQ